MNCTFTWSHTGVYANTLKQMFSASFVCVCVFGSEFCFTSVSMPQICCVICIPTVVMVHGVSVSSSPRVMLKQSVTVAAPTALMAHGIGKGKKVTSFPSFADKMKEGTGQRHCKMLVEDCYTQLPVSSVVPFLLWQCGARRFWAANHTNTKQPIRTSQLVLSKKKKSEGRPPCFSHKLKHSNRQKTGWDPANHYIYI